MLHAGALISEVASFRGGVLTPPALDCTTREATEVLGSGVGSMVRVYPPLPRLVNTPAAPGSKSCKGRGSAGSEERPC